jgi:hypothetical protein
MSLIYRAIWQDDPCGGVCDLAGERFTAWATGKWPDLTVPGSGVSRGRGARSGDHADLEVRIATAADTDAGIAQAYRADLIETFTSGARWHTTLRSWESSGSTKDIRRQWLWVDVEVVGDVDVVRLGVAAPKLVRDLLDRGKSPRVDDDALAPECAAMVGSTDGEWLAEVISRPERTLPIVVANDCPGARLRAAQHDLHYPDIVEKIRRRTAGMAAVYTVDNAAADGLIDALGRSYGLWDGAVRVYLADVDPAADNAWRHRYFTSARYARSKFVPGKAIANLLGPVSAVRRPPASYLNFKRLFEKVGTDGSVEELLKLADDELRESDAAINELREQIRKQEESLDGLAIDLGIATEERAWALREVENLERHVRSLQGQLNAPDEFYSVNTIQQDEQPPTIVTSMTEAVDMAKTYLSDRLVIPDAALHDLDDLDASAMSVAWAQTSWDGFLALHAYAVDRADGWDGGGFWEWCVNSKNPRAWRATDKKLAMKESDSVNNSPKLRRAREFPVATEFDPAGQIYMEAHLKIATGGGNLAPRIYFHFDDKRCQTHVGFIGPHKLLPNTKT